MNNQYLFLSLRRTTRIFALFLMTFWLAASGSAWGQSIFTNPITGTNPNTSNPYTTGQTVNANITVSGIGRGSGIAGATANNRYNASGWSTGAIDLNDYFEFVLTPNSGYEIDFVSFVYTGQESTAGRSFAFRSSVDGYTGNIGTPTGTGTTISLSAAAYQGITSAITFRFYGWAASAGTGTFSINDFTFNGTVTATGPTPTIALSSPSQIAAANVPQGTANHILSHFQAAVTTADATLNSIAFTTAGTHLAADLTGNFKLWYHSTSTFGSATQIGTVASGAAGARTFTGLSQAITNGATGFFWITADINSSATAGRTISVAANPTLTFAAGSPTGSITAGGAQTITDVTAPTATAFSPVDNATGVSITSNLVVTFSETIVKGTGNILIRRVSDNGIFETIAVTSGLVTVSTNTATINPASNFLNSTDYYVEIPNTAFTDAALNAYAGISGATTWNFTTVAATPTITVSAAALFNFGETYVDSSSTLQYYTVSGTGLTANIVITAPTHFVISSTCGSGYGTTVTLTQVSGTVNTTTIYARFKPTSTGAKSGNITHASTGASTINKAVAGTGVGTYIPAGYYSTAIGTGYTLKTQLKSIIDGHTKRTYDNLWTDYQNTDVKYNGKVWDMYSNKPCTNPDYEYTFITQQCTASPITAENQCYNREHVFPSSWFGGGTDAIFSGTLVGDSVGTDLQMVMPTDGWVNAERGNYPYAAVGSPSSTFTNGGKLGASTSSGYAGTSFEPIDEYKGDIARIMLYMAVRYERVIGSWQGNSIADDVLDGTSTQVYDTWFLNQLIAWHKADPVSHKEIVRNQQAYLIQGNRNPFIDNPTMVSGIWESDVTAPTATTFSPLDGATGVAINSNLVITFSENVIKGTGNILIKRSADNSTFATIDVTSGLVTVASNTVTINPSSDFLNSVGYYVEIPNTAFTDGALNAYAGISGATAWNFTTVAAGPCASETFVNIPTGTPSTYSTRNWTGDNGGAWSATLARTDQTITGAAIGLNNNGVLTSPTVAGGCGVITVFHKTLFSDASTFTVWVNGTQYGSAISSSATASSSNITVNVGGSVSVELRAGSSNSRIAFDDLSWTCYVACTAPTTAATSLSFSSVTATTMRISFTRGNGDGGVLAVLRQGSAPSAGPVSGTPYTADANFVGSGSALGSGKVIYNSNTPASGTVNIDVTGLTGGAISYYVAIYEYNTTGTCYIGTALSGNQATSALAPTVTTPTSAAITSTTATLGGNVTSDGGSAVTVRGVVWSTTDPTPTIAEGATNVTTTGTTGVFTTAVTGLPAGTLIYYAAYATNAIGTSYSTGSSFTTLTIASKLVITGTAFAAPVSAYTADQNFTITVQSQDAGNTPRNVTMNTQVTLSVSSGTGSLTVLTGTITAGTNSVTITSTYTEAEAGVQFIASATSGMSLTASVASTAVQFYGLDEVVYPQYMQGVNGTNNNRLPVAYRMTISGLNASSTYRYVNAIVSNAEASANNGVGGSIYVANDGTFTFTSSGDLGGTYGEFTTDASGNYTGWFVNVPNANATFTPGADIRVRIRLNDGAGGTAVVTRITSRLTMKVLNLVASAGANNATAIRSTSQGTAKNFVVLHDNVAGTGRPLSTTYIESEGVTSATITGMPAFYSGSVDGVTSAWGTLIPNTNANGVRYIAERSRTTGEVIGCASTDADGIWPNGSISTVNPTGGGTARVIASGDAPLSCQPEIQVLQDVTNYNTASTFDFGTVPQSTNSDVVFKIKNLGQSTLTISGNVVAGTGYSLLAAPAASVLAGDSTTFTVRFFSATTGSFPGTVTLTHNDASGSESPYVVNFTAAVLPEITVEESGLDIPDGSGSVNFGTASPGGEQDRIFVVSNIGGGDLIISAPVFGGAEAAQYSLVGGIGVFPMTVLPGENTSFIIRFSPTAGANGVLNATFSFTTNDANENPYNFALAGTRVTPPTVSINAKDVTPTAQFTLGSQYNSMYRIALKANISDATLTSLMVTTLGTYNILDVTSFRLWHSTDNTFNSATDTQIGTPLTAATGTDLLFDGFTQTLPSTDTAYFFVTANIRIDNAASTKTVGVKMNGFSDLGFSGTPNTGTITIYDGAAHLIVSPSVKFNLASANLTEGTGAGSTSYNIPLRFFGVVPSNQDITITLSGTATGGGTDFSFGTPGAGLTKISENATTLVVRTGTITTPATINIPITVVRDGLDEADETAIVTISGAGSIFIDNSSKEFTLNILDDDIKSVVSFTTSEEYMGEAGGLTYTVTMDIIPALAVGGNIVINVAETDLTYGGVSPNDYTTSPAKSGSTITIPVVAGQTSASFTVTVNSDDANVNAKTINSKVVFTLSSVPSNAEIGVSGTTHTLRIVEGTILERGDLAIVGFNTDNVDGPGGADEISFVCFKDLTPGTVIDITDNAYNKCTPGIASPSSSNYITGGFGESEGWVRMTFSTGANIPKGTIITVEIAGAATSNYPGSSLISPAGRTWTFAPLSSNHGNFDLNADGEQIFFAQGGTLNDNGTGVSATYGDDLYEGGRILYVFNTKGNIWTPICANSGGGGTKNSDKPTGMDCFISYNPSGTADYNKYTGPVTAASQREWIARIQGSTNWTPYANAADYTAGGINYRGGYSFTINAGNFTSGIWEGTAGTRWFDCRNWQSLTVPERDVDVTIRTGALSNVVIDSATAECRNITIETTRTLTISNLVSPGGNLNVYNNFVNQGTFTHAAGTVSMLGTTPSEIRQTSGTIAFRSLNINNSGGIILRNNISVTSALTLTAGTLDMNGMKITLNSGSVDVLAGALAGDVNGSTLEFTGVGSTTIPSGSFDQVIVNRTGETITMAGDLILRGSLGTALNYENGTLNVNSYLLQVEAGNMTGANGIIQAKGTNSDLVFNGIGAVGTLRTLGTFDDFTLNRNTSGSITLGNNLTIGDECNLPEGSLTINGQTLILRGDINWSNGLLVGGATSNLTVEQVDGTTARLVLPTPTGGLNNIAIRRLNGMALFGNLSAVGAVSFSASPAAGGIYTTGDTLDLGTTGSISGETANVNTRFVSGILKATRTVGAGASSTFGNIGVSVGTAPNNLGSVRVYRYSGSEYAATFNSATGIGRLWAIRPTTQPSSAIDLALTWPADDDNGKLITTNAQVYRRPEGSADWLNVGSTQNPNIVNSMRTVTVSTTSFSDWTVSDDLNILPVTLVSFTGKASEGLANLQWATLSERGNDGFVIEKSNDGQYFEYAGFVKGVGTTNQKQNYSFPDHKFSGSAYYRLAQYDDNGKVNYSNTIFLSLNRQGNVSFSLYPNPAHEAVTLTMQGQLNNETLQLQVVATDGRTISLAQGTVQDLNKELNAIVGGLAQGVYMLKITSETDVQILRLVKE